MQTKIGGQGGELGIDSIRDLFRQDISYLLFEGHFLEISIHVPIVAKEDAIDLFKLLPLPALVTKDKDSEPILYQIDPKDSILEISLDESVYYDIDKSQLSDCNKIQDKLFCEHSLVRHKWDSSSSCLAAVYGGHKKKYIGKNCDLTVSQRNEFVYAISSFGVLCYTARQRIMIKGTNTKGNTEIKNLFIGPGLSRIQLPPDSSCTVQTNFYGFDSSPMISEKIKIEYLKSDDIPIEKLLNSSNDRIIEEIHEIMKIPILFSSKKTIPLEVL